MKLEDYRKYYIQGSDHYLIPKDIFVELFDEMINWKQESEELKKQLEVGEEQYNDIVEEKEKLQERIDYLRSGEYYNQLRFENKMLQHIVDNGEVSKEDREFIDCTHRNTELLEQQKKFIKYLEEEKDRLVKECSSIYEDGLGKTKLVNKDIYNEINKILSKIEKE